MKHTKNNKQTKCAIHYRSFPSYKKMVKKGGFEALSSGGGGTLTSGSTTKNFFLVSLPLFNKIVL